ncbi:MAG: hypothetical protein AMJ66_00205 [Betaproteobacteria bacterium SG8_40]|nr:MAG: hypothetical protein AMJ66_00205 [Betaproteobacteria bacterium SG8_40]
MKAYVHSSTLAALPGEFELTAFSLTLAVAFVRRKQRPILLDVSVLRYRSYPKSGAELFM